MISIYNEYKAIIKILSFYKTKSSKPSVYFTFTAHPNSNWPHFKCLVATIPSGFPTGPVQG